MNFLIFPLLIFITLLTSGVSSAEGGYERSQFNLQGTRESFTSEYITRDVLATVDEIPNDPFEVIAISVHIMRLNAMLKKISPVSGAHYIFVNSKGERSMAGTTVDSIEGFDERERFEYESKQHVLNAKLQVDVVQLRTRFLHKLVAIIDRSAGAEKNYYQDLYQELEKSGRF